MRSSVPPPWSDELLAWQVRAALRQPSVPAETDKLRWRLVGTEAPLRPRSLYAASKTAQEHYALAWAESAGGSVVALRYHNVYGPGMPRDTPYSGVAAIFRSSLSRNSAGTRRSRSA